MTTFVPAGTVVRYAVLPADTSAIAYVDGLSEHWPKLPVVGQTLTVPFLVDPATRQPVAVRVVELQNRLTMHPPTIVVVVGRQH